ncbi:hypothetical protein CVT25_012252, partial [Psilocybe cyanescens]
MTNPSDSATPAPVLTPAPLPTMGTTIIQRTPVDMPVPTATGAPKFSGSYTEVKNFLDQCDRLFLQYSVTTDDEKVRYMYLCCNCQSRKIVEGLSDYHTKEWNGLKAQMLAIFDHDRNTQKFTLTTELIYKRDRFDMGVFDNPSAQPYASLLPSNDIKEENSSLLDEIKRYIQAIIPSNGAHNVSDDHAVRPPEETRRIFKDLEKEEIKAHQADEVENLIKEMTKLTISEPNYAVYYFRAVKLEPSLAGMLVAPAIMNATVPQQPKQPSSFAPPPPQQTQYMQHARTSLADMTCYGCNQQGHGMNTCPGLADLASKKVITRDSSNRIVFADGSRIFRVMGESIIQAVQRQRPAPAPIATSNLAICDPYYVEEKYNANIFEEDDEDDIGSYLGDSDYILAGPSNRIVPERKIRTARKQVFDGVIVPEPAYIKAKRLEAKGKMKEKENTVPFISILKRPTAPEKPEIPNSSTPVLINPPVAPPVNQTVNQPVTVKETPSVKQPIAPPVINPIVPALPQTSRPHVSFDPSDDDQIMEDATIKPNKDKSPAKPRVPAQKWIAEVSRGVDPMAIAQRCLNRSADVTLGELMGVSKDVKNCIGSLIKAKTISVEEFRSKFASYDPNINIYTAFTNIEPELPPDAIPLNVGSVQTWANCFVSDRVKFDVLVGRPWTRDNFVDVLERPEGTLLSFYDPGDETHVRKFLALPDSHPNSMAFITEETPST